MVLFLFAIRRSPSCRPSLARCRGRQTGHFLEIASLLPPPAALRRFPRPARSAFQSRGEAGFLRMASPFAGCREASSSLVARSKRHHLRRWCFFFLPFGAHRRAGRLSPAVAVDRRGTSSKSPRFFRHRRRFGDFLDLREARSNHEVRQGSCEWPRHSQDAGKRVRASSPAPKGTI